MMGIPNSRVVAVDIDIRAHNRAEIEAHPMAKHITMLQGSSVDPVIFNQVKALAADEGKDYDKLEGERSMSKTVDAFNVITGLGMTDTQGWLFMMCLKQVRAFSGFHPHEDSLGPQARNVAGHVGCTAQAIFSLSNPNNRHRRLRRDAVHLAPPVPVEHQVTDHQNTDICKGLWVHRAALLNGVKTVPAVTARTLPIMPAGLKATDTTDVKAQDRP
jgi:hypothetical protein